MTSSPKWVNSQEKASANYGLGQNPFLHLLRYGSQTKIFFFFFSFLKGLVKKKENKNKKHANLNFQMITLNLALIYGMDAWLGMITFYFFM